MHIRLAEARRGSRSGNRLLHRFCIPRERVLDRVNAAQTAAPRPLRAKGSGQSQRSFASGRLIAFLGELLLAPRVFRSQLLKITNRNVILFRLVSSNPISLPPRRDATARASREKLIPRSSPYYLPRRDRRVVDDVGDARNTTHREMLQLYMAKCMRFELMRMVHVLTFLRNSLVNIF